MYNRYDNINKFITDIDKLKMDKYGTVYISEEDDYDISVCLDEQMERFEELKPVIIKVAEHVCELDNIVQRYYKKCCKNSQKYYKSMFKDYPDVVNIKELQIMLGGISKKLAYQLLRNNIIKSIKIGRQYKIAKADVILYLTEKKLLITRFLIKSMVI